MTDLTTLRDLEGRLEAATEGSRELDALLSLQFYDMSRYVEKHTGYFVHVDCLDDPDKGEWEVAHFTSSLDAAIALVERVMPDRMVKLHRDLDNSWFWRASLLGPDDADWTTASSKSPALALCLALIRALIARGEP